MAKKQSEVSINKLEKYCKIGAPVAISKFFNISPDEKVEYQVKPRLSLEECIMFVNDVVGGCVRSQEVMIIPMARQFITYRNVLIYYGNFRMPEDISKTFDLIMGSNNIIMDILDSIDKAQYNMILLAIEDGISFEKQKLISTQEQKTNELIAEVNSFVTRMSGLFDGINGEQMATFVSGLSTLPNVTAEDLAKAVTTTSHPASDPIITTTAHNF